MMPWYLLIFTLHMIAGPHVAGTAKIIQFAGRVHI
jgi:hypothetical protein